MNSPFFSIIIPVYNTEDYISRCLQSCLEQTFGDFEIIIIDDCGEDNAISIALKYAQQDARIQIIRNKKNLGLFATRIVGEKHSKGQYIIHLDSDDFLVNHTCEKIFQTIQENNLSEIDLLRFNATTYPDNQSQQHFPNSLSIARKKTLKSLFFDTETPIWTIWRHAYNAKLIQTILQNHQALFDSFPRITMGEDALKFLFVLIHIQSYASINDVLYRYVENCNSLTRINNENANRARIQNLKSLLNIFYQLKAYTPFRIDELNKRILNKTIILIKYNIDVLCVDKSYFFRYLTTLRYRPLYWKTYVRLTLNLATFGRIQI